MPKTGQNVAISGVSMAKIMVLIKKQSRAACAQEPLKSLSVGIFSRAHHVRKSLQKLRIMRNWAFVYLSEWRRSSEVLWKSIRPGISIRFSGRQESIFRRFRHSGCTIFYTTSDSGTARKMSLVCRGRIFWNGLKILPGLEISSPCRFGRNTG